MNVQEIKEALFPFRDYANGERLFEGMNAADLADFLDSLGETIDGTVHRLEVVLDEDGAEFRDALKVLRDFIENHYGDHDYPVPAKLENALMVIQREDGHTTPVYVKPGVTVKEVGLGASIRPEDEAAPAYIKTEGDDDFSEEFLYEFRKHLPPEWDVRVADGRLEVREWADRSEPLFHFDITRHSPHELIVGLPEIIGAMMTQMHRDFCGLLEFTKEAVAGCVEPGDLAKTVVHKVKSTPISWELSEGILDAFLGPDRAGEPILLGLPCPRCNGTGRADRVPSVSNIGDPCRTCDGTGFVPE